jgi:mannose-6-phosphate isomerase-like protein (cupin superfamily)
MHASLETLAITAETDTYRGQWTVLGEMHVSYEHCAAGSNIDDMVAIFENHACPVEHWGYVFSGSVRVEFTDGHEETFSAGDVFYVPPGHRPYMLEDTVLLQLTRKHEFEHMIGEIRKAGRLPS